MTNPPDLHVAPFEDRRDLALSHLLLTMQRNGGFASHADYDEAARLFTTTDPIDMMVGPLPGEPSTDLVLLAEDLHARFFWYAMKEGAL